MLVLTRRPNESIMIGDNIVLEILSINGNQTKIGITAPQSVKIVRDELTDAGRQKKYHNKVVNNGNVFDPTRTKRVNWS